MALAPFAHDSTRHDSTWIGHAGSRGVTRGAGQIGVLLTEDETEKLLKELDDDGSGEISVVCSPPGAHALES